MPRRCGQLLIQPPACFENKSYRIRRKKSRPAEVSSGILTPCAGPYPPPKVLSAPTRSARVIPTSSMLDSDPSVEEAGVDTGYSPTSDTLRAPDVAVGNVPNTPGWVQGAPPLAVEYCDTGQDGKELAVKISDLLAAGTRIVWVVHLSGPRRVEVHENGQEPRLVRPGEELTAPAILQNP